MNLAVLLVLGGALVASLLLNVFFIWYFRNLASRLRFISENLGALVEETVSFRDHLESIHDLEMFYGDETLQEMIQHSKELSEYLQGLSNSVVFSYEDEKEEIEEHDE